MVDFPKIDTTFRVPGVRFEFNASMARRGLVPNPQKVLLVGNRTSEGTITDGEIVPIFDERSSLVYFGRGSILAGMCKAALRQFPYCQLEALAVDDASAGVAATGFIVFSGTATKTHTMTVYIGPVRVQVLIEKDDTAANVATALKDACVVTKQPWLYATVEVEQGNPSQVNITAKNKGETGNSIWVKVEFSTAGGISASVNGVQGSLRGHLSNGATNPALSNYSDKITGKDYQWIAVAWSDSDNLSTLHGICEDMAHPMVGKRPRASAGFTGDYSDAIQLAAAINSQYLTLGWLKNSHTPPWEIASIRASNFASEPDPAAPFDDDKYSDIMPPFDTADWPSDVVLNNALFNGVSPLKIDWSSDVRETRAITTYIKDAQGNEDDTFLDINPLGILYYYRKCLVARLSQAFSNRSDKKITEDVLGKIRDLTLDVARSLEDAKILRNIEDHKDEFIVEEDSQNIGHVKVYAPAPVVPGLHNIDGTLFLLYY